MTLEQSDLNIQLSFGFVCAGKMCDFLKLRDEIRKSFPNVSIVYNKMSAEYLFILKKSELTPEQTKKFDKEKKE